MPPPHRRAAPPAQPRKPFRAGRTGIAPETAAAVPEFQDAVVLLADISEFQPDLADATYLDQFSKAIVIRALYGTTADRAWYGGGRRSALHAGGARFVGIYQYLVAGEDPAAQADALGNLVGHLRPGEKLLCDIEEGAGSQQARWVAWADRVAQLGDDPWDYSGAAFARSAGLAPVDWVASYGSAEPGEPHQLWQFTDSYDVPGVGSADCSVFHGDIGQLAALAYQGEPAPTPVKPPPVPAGPDAEEDAMTVLDNLPSGGPAVVLPVPSGKTKLLLYADGGVGRSVPPVIRVGTTPKWNDGVHVTPLWGKPAVTDLPAGTTQVTIARVDTGNVAVTAAWE